MGPLDEIQKSDAGSNGSDSDEDEDEDEQDDSDDEHDDSESKDDGKSYDMKNNWGHRFLEEDVEMVATENESDGGKSERNKTASWKLFCR